jgi:CRP-like cAMP-binding protein
VLSSRYDEEMIFKQKIMYVDQFLRNKSLHKNVRTKVRRYLEHVLENKREQKIDESEILTLLNKNLKEEVIMHLNGLLLKNGTFGVINKFDEFCILLTSVMREETLNPGDTIFQKGDHSLRLYFINNGIVTIFDQETKIIFKELNNEAPLNSFGEIGFFAGQKRSTSAESLTFVNLTYILIDVFKEMAYKFHQINQEKFKLFEDDISKLRKEIRAKQYSKLKLKCYLCDANLHIAPDCPKLMDINEFFEFKFKDRRHKTEQEIKRIFEYISTNAGSTQEDRRRTSIISYPSFTKNTNDLFFSFADLEQQEDSIAVNSLSIDQMSDSHNSDESNNYQVESGRKLQKSASSPKLSNSHSSEKNNSSKLFYLRNTSMDQNEKSTDQKRPSDNKNIEDMDDVDINNEILVMRENKITYFNKLNVGGKIVSD